MKQRGNRAGLKRQVSMPQQQVKVLTKKSPNDASKKDKDKDHGTNNKWANPHPTTPTDGHAFGSRAELKQLKQG